MTAFRYPYQSPSVKFSTPCFHPNVDNQGNICLDILKEKWSALYEVRLLSICFHCKMMVLVKGLIARVSDQRFVTWYQIFSDHKLNLIILLWLFVTSLGSHNSPLNSVSTWRAQQRESSQFSCRRFVAKSGIILAQENGLEHNFLLQVAYKKYLLEKYERDTKSA